jgi:hypothetical protein
MSFSGMWRCVDPELTDVLEESIASVFRVEKFARGKPASAGRILNRNDFVFRIFSSLETELNTLQHSVPCRLLIFFVYNIFCYCFISLKFKHIVTCIRGVTVIG